MIRLLIINHVTTRSGGEIALLRIIRGLDKSKFEPVVALPSHEGMLPEVLVQIPGVDLRVIPTGGILMGARRFSAFRTLLWRPGIILDFLDLVRRYVCLIREERIDLVLTNSIKSDYYGSLAAFAAGKPVVWYLHDFVDRHYFPWWARVSLALFANMFAAKVCCNSRATRSALLKAKVASSKCLTVYLPPVEPMEAPIDSDIRRALGLSSATRLITMVGRITAPKGQLEFVRAAERVMRDHKDVVFLVVGDSVFGAYDDEYKQKLVRAIRQLPRPDGIRLLGARDDALAIIAQSDMIVFPSLWPEGFGLAVAEAMEAGRPVVATPLGGTAELVEDGVTGLEVEPGDVAGLSRAICKLLDDPKTAHAMGQAGRVRIRNILSPSNICRLEQVLEQVAQSR